MAAILSRPQFVNTQLSHVLFALVIVVSTMTINRIKSNDDKLLCGATNAGRTYKKHDPTW